MFRKCVLGNFQNEFKIGSMTSHFTCISGKMPEKVNALIKDPHTHTSFAVINFFRDINL